MRQAGSLDSETLAQRFVDYLLTVGIEAKAEPGDHGWSIWIFDESQLAQSKTELAAFQADPAAEKYTGAAAQAATKRREMKTAQARAAKNIVQMRDRWQHTAGAARRPLTLALILACCMVGIITRFGEDLQPIEPYLFISGFQQPQIRVIEGPNGPTAVRIGGDQQGPLQEVREGEIWRLVTPIFIHMSIFHLLFNMLWLFSLGGLLEMRYGSWRLAWLVLVAAVGSNLCQYYWSGPAFGGMSGVVYALFGYIWMKGKFDPTAGFRLDERTIFLMMVWFFACFTGAVGPIANAAHTAGLVIGMVLGYLPVLVRR